MSFATPVFLWVFMPLVLGVYWVLPPRRRNAVLAIASLAFYMYGAKGDVILLLVGIGMNYAAGVAIGRADSDQFRNRILAAIVIADIGLLAYWKYAGFVSEQIANLGEALGDDSLPILEVALPIGISFFTFHMLSYVIDVWRGRTRRCDRPLDFVTYIAMFPQLIAGPIVRYHEISDQLEEVRTNRMDDLAAGFPRFAHGLFKKVVIADTIAPVADVVFGLKTGDLTTTTAWLGAIAYTLQIYFDFSGYTDMAIGLARMFGFRFPENFDAPVLVALDHRLLAPLAHVAVPLVPRLRVHLARRQPRRSRQDLPQPLHRVLPHRPVARRRVDVRDLGAATTARCW